MKKKKQTEAVKEREIGQTVESGRQRECSWPAHSFTGALGDFWPFWGSKDRHSDSETDRRRHRATERFTETKSEIDTQKEDNGKEKQKETVKEKLDRGRERATERKRNTETDGN